MMQTPEQRIERFRTLAEQFPESEVPRFSLAQAYRDADQLELAEEAFSKVASLKPDFMLAWIERGRCLLSLERYAEAEASIRKGLELAISQGHEEPRLDCEALLEEIEEERS